MIVSLSAVRSSVEDRESSRAGGSERKEGCWGEKVKEGDAMSDRGANSFRRRGLELGSGQEGTRRRARGAGRALRCGASGGESRLAFREREIQ